MTSGFRHQRQILEPLRQGRARGSPRGGRWLEDYCFLLDEALSGDECVVGFIAAEKTRSRRPGARPPLYARCSVRLREYCADPLGDFLREHGVPVGDVLSADIIGPPPRAGMVVHLGAGTRSIHVPWSPTGPFEIVEVEPCAPLE